jgi:hypothetical protein
MAKNKYEVIVSNVGTMEFTNKRTAMSNYKTYVAMAQGKIGRVAGENVALVVNGEIVKEYVGALAEHDFELELLEHFKSMGLVSSETKEQVNKLLDLCKDMKAKNPMLTARQIIRKLKTK